MNGDLSFNGNDLQTYNRGTQVGINTNVIEHTNIPEKLFTLFSIANADYSAIPNIDYPSKKIKIAGTIHGSSQDDLDSRIDTFLGYFVGKDKNLDIDYAGSTRRYIATENVTSIEREQKALFAKFTIEFICTQPFGRDTSSTNLFSSNNQTDASETFTPTIGGNAPYQLPIITLTIDALTGTNDYIQISNDQNGQSMLLIGLGITAADVIVINSETREVTVNGDVVDYEGVFLELTPDSAPASITISNGFETRTIDYLGIYYKRWL